MRHKKKVISISLIILFLVLAFILFSTKEKPEISESEKIYCKAEQRNIDVCIEIYAPVCGWSDSNIIKTYSNSCFACMDENVLFYTESECE